MQRLIFKQTVFILNGLLAQTLNRIRILYNPILFQIIIKNKRKSSDNDASVESFLEGIFVSSIHQLVSCDVLRSFSEYKRQNRKSFQCEYF